LYRQIVTSAPSASFTVRHSGATDFLRAPPPRRGDGDGSIERSGGKGFHGSGADHACLARPSASARESPPPFQKILSMSLFRALLMSTVIRAAVMAPVLAE